MKLIDLFYELAVKCGSQNEPAVIDVLSRIDLQNVMVADELACFMIRKLLTIESAKSNKILKKHFTALALSAADAEIMHGAEMLELDSDFKKELSSESNTYEKQRKMMVRIKEVIDELKKRQPTGL